MIFLPAWLGRVHISVEDVLKEIQRPELLLDVYGPIPSMGGYQSIESLYNAWSDTRVSENGQLMPSFRALEQRFAAKWRSPINDVKVSSPRWLR